jgi:hypothetical protein
LPKWANTWPLEDCGRILSCWQTFEGGQQSQHEEHKKMLDWLERAEFGTSTTRAGS